MSYAGAGLFDRDPYQAALSLLYYGRSLSQLGASLTVRCQSLKSSTASGGQLFHLIKLNGFRTTELLAMPSIDIAGCVRFFILVADDHSAGPASAVGVTSLICGGRSPLVSDKYFTVTFCHVTPVHRRSPSIPIIWSCRSGLKQLNSQPLATNRPCDLIHARFRRTGGHRPKAWPVPKHRRPRHVWNRTWRACDRKSEFVSLHRRTV
jgi:hypothetical protein